MGAMDNDRYQQLALQGSGGLSGNLSRCRSARRSHNTVYEKLPKADITCLDYSEKMLAKAKGRAERCKLSIGLYKETSEPSPFG
jgi:hypothetical protein